MKKIYQVDAFADQPFRGNPAGVCILQSPASDEWMQSLATEMNLSETAFVREVQGGFDLRWFTPTCEVDLCGHATLATAHILWEEGILAVGQDVLFFTHSGELSASHKDNLIVMDFPADCAREVSGEDSPEGLLSALGIKETAKVYKGSVDYIIELESEQSVRELNVDFKMLTSMTAGDTRGFIVTALSAHDDFDFVSRFFAPACGINEDPVTGSAHALLGPFWAGRLGRNQLRAFQASKRGGVVMVSVAPGGRVFLGGYAKTVFMGRLCL